MKYVGRRLTHLLQESDSDVKSQWYPGVVLSVIREIDEDDDALYEVVTWNCTVSDQRN